MQNIHVIKNIFEKNLLQRKDIIRKLHKWKSVCHIFRWYIGKLKDSINQLLLSGAADIFPK